MTDSSSKGESPEVAQMAGELFQAKIGRCERAHRL